MSEASGKDPQPQAKAITELFLKISRELELRQLLSDRDLRRWRGHAQDIEAGTEVGTIAAGHLLALGAHLLDYHTAGSTAGVEMMQAAIATALKTARAPAR